MDGPEPIGVVANEFATVSVSIDHSAHSPRLRLEDQKSGQVGYLDALELETLAWLAPNALHTLLDPSAVRWRNDR
jgi:hypothetical protein